MNHQINAHFLQGSYKQISKIKKKGTLESLAQNDKEAFIEHTTEKKKYSRK